MNELSLSDRAARVFPNGIFGHLSTRKLPEAYPQFFQSAHGTRLRDVQGREYIDYMCAYGPNLFGYADPEIDEAFIRQLRLGDTMTGPSPISVDLAELFTDIVSHADWTMFCKNGTDATTIALMIARQFSGHEKVIVARGSYHGAMPQFSNGAAGITPNDKADRIYCDYNSPDSLEAAVREAGGKFAAIFATPLKHDVYVDQAPPNPEYARLARRLADENGALLVVDDVRAGFRITRDCSWAAIGVAPDLSAWGKSIANGHALSALLGADRARRAAAEVFVTGSFWLQAAPIAAAITTLRRIRDTPYLEQLFDLGRQLRDGLDLAAQAHGVGFRQSGPETMPLFLFDDDADLRKGFYWCTEMLRYGIYFHPWHNMFLNAAMTKADIDETIAAAHKAFASLRSAFPSKPAG